MTERFTETISTGIVTDNKTGKEYNCEMRIADNFLNLVNNIAEENENLNLNYKELRYANDIYCQKIDSLKKENKQIKKQLDYIQNSINTHIKHQKTELGQKALKEIIQDYNEWLLGHKGE